MSGEAVLVTGGAGLPGSAVAAAPRATGRRAIALDLPAAPPRGPDPRGRDHAAAWTAT